MDYTLPLNITKNITFPRMRKKDIEKYEIWGVFKDPSYDSGFRYELLETIPNPEFPTFVEYSKMYEYSITNTYELPKGCVIDREHKLRVYIDGALISSLWHTHNRKTNMFTINKTKISMDSSTEIMVKYYKDVIQKEYALTSDCEIIVKPIFLASYHYGDHNIIL